MIKFSPLNKDFATAKIQTELLLLPCDVSTYFEKWRKSREVNLECGYFLCLSKEKGILPYSLNSLT